MNVYEIITDRIIKELESGIIPWEKPWVNTSGTNVARSHNDGRIYSILNQMCIGMPGEYATFKQVTAEKGTVKKGAKKGSSYERRVIRAVEKDYFNKLTYDRTYRVFELSDRVNNMEDYKNRFIGKNCPNCGAPLKIKKGFSVICDKCGQEVKA